jgi:hypothetical protein
MEISKYPKSGNKMAQVSVHSKVTEEQYDDDESSREQVGESQMFQNRHAAETVEAETVNYNY